MGALPVPSEQCQCFEFCAIFLSDRSKLRHKIAIPPLKGAFVSTVQSVLQRILFVKEDYCADNQLKTPLEIFIFVAMQIGQEVFFQSSLQLNHAKQCYQCSFWGCPNEAK